MNYVVADHIESWLLIDGYNNYEVSSIGRIRNNETKRILKTHVNTNGYVVTTLSSEGRRKTYQIHRLVAEAFCKNPDEKLVVDHIDMNPQNNHYTNLRWTTCSENNRNRKLSSRNTSGYRGIWFDDRFKDWRAEYRLNGLKTNLGYFKTKEEAARAYDKAILEVDPEHCVLNFPIPENQRNVYISYCTLKKHLADIKAVIDGFNKINS